MAHTNILLALDETAIEALNTIYKNSIEVDIHYREPIDDNITKSKKIIVEARGDKRSSYIKNFIQLALEKDIKVIDAVLFRVYTWSNLRMNERYEYAYNYIKTKLPIVELYKLKRVNYKDDGTTPTVEELGNLNTTSMTHFQVF